MTSEPAQVAPIRVCMWSGPRNLSTALMRAFENRSDTVVVDEPFYAAYLAATGAEHPMREAVLASQSTDPEAVAQALTRPIPGGPGIFYQKHMTHHMIAGFPLAWMDACRHAFLIRRPDQVVASYAARRETVSLEAIGVVRQAELFDREADRLGHAPPVIDAADLLAGPRGLLESLCDRLGLAFTERMLSWPAGPRASDGVWSSAWYAGVERSTGFQRDEGRTAQPLSGENRAVAVAAQPFYQRLAAWRLTAREPHPRMA